MHLYNSKIMLQRLEQTSKGHTAQSEIDHLRHCWRHDADPSSFGIHEVTQFCIGWTISTTRIVGKRRVDPNIDSILLSQTRNSFKDLLIISAFTNLQKMDFMIS